MDMTFVASSGASSSSAVIPVPISILTVPFPTIWNFSDAQSSFSSSTLSYKKKTFLSKRRFMFLQNQWNRSNFSLHLCYQPLNGIWIAFWVPFEIKCHNVDLVQSLINLDNLFHVQMILGFSANIMVEVQNFFVDVVPPDVDSCTCQYYCMNQYCYCKVVHIRVSPTFSTSSASSSLSNNSVPAPVSTVLWLFTNCAIYIFWFGHCSYCIQCNFPSFHGSRTVRFSLISASSVFVLTKKYFCFYRGYNTVKRKVTSFSHHCYKCKLCRLCWNEFSCFVFSAFVWSYDASFSTRR